MNVSRRWLRRRPGRGAGGGRFGLGQGVGRHGLEELLPRAWVERRYRDLRHWHVADRGGHFPMLEVPEAFSADLRAAFAHAPA